MPEPMVYSVRVKLREPLFDAVTTYALSKYRDLPAQIEQFIVEGLERRGALSGNPISTVTAREAVRA